jgi:hypothetical protein
MSYLTEDDVANFGPEMLDLAQRAGLHAVAPHLHNLEQQNAELRHHLARETKRNLDQALERAVPNWREVNNDPRFIEWLDNPDPLSGRTRQQLLNEATARGDARRIIAFLKGFLAEAAGHHGQPSQAAAGAGGKPIYTRAQIRDLAAKRRKGAYTDAQWAALEAEIVAAGREGRIAGALSLDGR